MNSKPISFIVVCDLKLERVYRSVSSIRKWVGIEKEIIVVYCNEKPRFDNMNEIVLVPADPETGLGHLRYKGFKSAKGKWIAYLEEHCEIAGPGYIEGILEMAEMGHTGIGGVVNIGNTSSDVSRLLSLINFFPFSKSLISSQTQSLPGYNAVYHRDELNSLGKDPEIFGYDLLMVRKLIGGGMSLGLSPKIEINHYFEKTWVHSLKLNYYFNVCYGYENMIRMQPSVTMKIFNLLKAFSIPVVRTIKILYAIWAQRRDELGPTIRYLPMLALIQTATFFGVLRGLTFGKGNCERIFKDLELNIER